MLRVLYIVCLLVGLVLQPRSLRGADLEAFVTDLTNGSTISFLNARSGTQTNAVALDATAYSGAVYTPNGKLAIVDTSNGTRSQNLIISELPSGKQMKTLELGGRPFACSPDSTKLYAVYPAQRGSTFYILDLTTFEVQQFSSSLPYPFIGLVLSPDGTSIYAAPPSGPVVYALSSTDFHVLAKYTIGSATYLGPLTPSPDGTRLYVSNNASFPAINQVSAVDLSTGQVIGSFLSDSSAYAAVSPDSTTVYTTLRDAGSGEETVIQVSAATLTVMNSIPLPVPPGAFEPLSISTDGGTLAVETSSPWPTVTLLSLPSLAIASVNAVGNLCGIQFLPSDKVAVTNCYTNTVQSVDLTKKRAKRRFDAGPGPYSVLLSPNGETLYVANGSGVWVLAAQTGKIVSKISFQGGNFGGPVVPPLVLSADGTVLFASAVNGIEIISTITNQSAGLLSTLPAGFVAAGGFATSPDGQYLFVAGEEGGDDYHLLVMSQSNGALLQDVPSPQLGVTLVPSHDSTVVYFVGLQPGSGSEELSVFSVASGTFGNAVYQGGYAALSPDGAVLYLSNGGSVVAVNTTTLSATTLESPVNPLEIALTPDGTQLVVTSNTGTSIGVIDLANSANSYSVTTGSGTLGLALR